MRLAGIWRYPVKSLAGEALARVTLEPGAELPGDRRFALAHGRSNFDPEAPRWLPKSQFLALVRNERLARLECRLDEASGILALRDRESSFAVRTVLADATDRTAFGAAVAAWMGAEAMGGVRLVEAPGLAFADVPAKTLTLIGHESLEDFGRASGQAMDARRFRPNLLVEGLPPLEELGWEGRTLAVGGVRFEVLGRVDRCAAIEVDPDTAQRRSGPITALQRLYGHVDMGIYLKTIAGGTISVGDSVALER